MCAIKNCRRKDVEVIYKGHELCYKHWLAYCDDELDLDKELQNV